MTALVPPDVALHESWAAAMLELDGQAHGSGLHAVAGGLALDVTAAGCAAYVAGLRRLAAPADTLPEGRVPTEHWWVVDDSHEVVGFVALRPELDAWHEEVAGHVAYSVRPSRRRRGHATRALAQALDRAAELGLAEVLVVCDEDNAASRAVVERCGGVLSEVRRGRCRYQVATPAARDGAGAAPA